MSKGHNLTLRGTCGLLRHLASPLARQTAFLFAVDGLANGIDYLFHVYVGRNVTPGDFAVVQTVNGALLIRRLREVRQGATKQPLPKTPVQ